MFTDLNTGENYIYKPREWQVDAFRKCRESNGRDQHGFVNLIAGVGAGKTDVAAYAIYDFIRKHPGETTVSLFVAPRINLCRQQLDAIRKYASFMLEENTDVDPKRLKCWEINSKSPQRRDIEALLNIEDGYHYVFVICAPSYFSPKKYLPYWGTLFDHWTERGIRMGVRVYDEAHNYKTKSDLIVGRAWYFCTDLLMSGTPAPYQLEMEAEYDAQCSVKKAMERGWTVQPKLYFVKGNWNQSFRSIILDMVQRELQLSMSEGVAPRMMVSCKKISQIEDILDMKVFKEGAGEVFNVISIHSEKPDQKPRVNGVEVSSRGALQAIQALDSNNAAALAKYGIDPKLMTIVLQVDMISEGINVKSFNSVIVTTSVIRKAMQQFGRVFRNYDIDGFSKRKNGHASVYVVQESSQDFMKFFEELKDNYGVDFDCFQL